MKPKVCIIGGGMIYAQLFKDFTVIEGPEFADLLVFTGGEDVNPEFYGETKHPRTYSNPSRDLWERGIFQAYKDKPKVGICRGGQFLNVMSGGAMYQHVDGHANGPHLIYTPDGSTPLCQATSTHHQMMVPSVEGEVLAIANESKSRETASTCYKGAHDDVEVVYYDATKSLCFQPHPEFPTATEGLRAFFFDCLKTKLGVLV